MRHNPSTIETAVKATATAGSPVGSARSMTQALRGRDWTPLLRVATVVIALAILYLRMPTTFTNPQFWGEDIIFFDESRAHGWSSLTVAVAGWLAGVQFLVACLAQYVSPVHAPAIYNGAAIALTLLVVWMVTSPRLDLSYKPLLALAVVVVPMGYEELGTLTNSQWILPIGAIAMMFMRAAPSPLVLVAEAIFVALTSFSGPFPIFLAPMFLWRFLTAEARPERRRLLIFTLVAFIGAASQVLSLYLNPAILSSIAPVPYPWTLWVNLPFKQWMTTFGPASAVFDDVQGVFLGSALLVLVLVGSSIRPYRTQKLFMMFFAIAIAAAGMYKFRIALGTQLTSQRYFYFGGVFALWFICCLSDQRHLRMAAAAFVAVVELMLLPVVANTPRITKDLNWPIWASYLSSGLPTLIPSSPDSFYLGSPATADGPLAKFAPWIGQHLADVAGTIDPSSCAGAIGPIRPLWVSFVQKSYDPKKLGPTWITSGAAWAQDRPVQLVVLVDQDDRVIGFGLPGFAPPDAGSPPQSGWTAIFSADPGKIARAYGIVEDGKRICALANERYFPLKTQPLASGEFINGLEILPGRDLVQRFKPAHRLEEVTAKFVTWGVKPDRYTIRWQIVARSHGRVVELGAGTIDSNDVTDWLRIKLPVSIVPQQVPDQIEITFRTDHDRTPAAPIGLPVYRPEGENTAPPAETGGVPVSSGGLLGLDLSYPQ
jgi:hypothetical protein